MVKIRDLFKKIGDKKGTTDCFQIGKGVCQGCILNPAYLTSMQSTSCEILVWISTIWSQDCQEKCQQPQICR